MWTRPKKAAVLEVCLEELIERLFEFSIFNVPKRVNAVEGLRDSHDVEDQLAEPHVWHHHPCLEQLLGDPGRCGVDFSFRHILRHQLVPNVIDPSFDEINMHRCRPDIVGQLS
jgi:hypothetical protein